jgi:P27 family predicted phage terminase small subunit
MLQGNPGKRHLNTNEVQPMGGAEKPLFVTGEAAKAWDRAISAMPPGFYTAADVPTITVLCLAMALHEAALDLVAKDGMTSIGSMGQVVAHPFLAVASKQADIIMRAADRLGMSPVARTRLSISEEGGVSKFSGLLGVNRLN